MPLFAIQEADNRTSSTGGKSREGSRRGISDKVRKINHFDVTKQRPRTEICCLQKLCAILYIIKQYCQHSINLSSSGNMRIETDGEKPRMSSPKKPVQILPPSLKLTIRPFKGIFRTLKIRRHCGYIRNLKL